MHIYTLRIFFFFFYSIKYSIQVYVSIYTYLSAPEEAGQTIELRLNRTMVHMITHADQQ